MARRRVLRPGRTPSLCQCEAYAADDLSKPGTPMLASLVVVAAQ